MARLALAASILAILGDAQAAPATPEEQLKGSIIRRHKDSSEIHLGPSGEMSLLHREDPSSDRCNHNYNLGTENSNTCIKGVHIEHPDDCVFAASGLGPGYKAAPKEKFVVTPGRNGWSTPLAMENYVAPYPKNCFALNGVVYFNPTETSPTAWQGTPVCERELYPKASPSTSNPAGQCPQDFEPITDFTECTEAWSCVEGNSGCREADFENAARVTSQTKPKGCYRETNGCFNFNHIGAAPTGTVSGATTMCKLTGGTPPPVTIPATR